MISRPARTILLYLALFSSLLSPLFPGEVEALTGSDFKPGRIIDDAIFYNNHTMDPNQIQRFLDAKVPVCDTWHARYTGSSGTVYDPPFTCLNQYQENTDSKENNIGRLNSDGTPYNVPGGKSAAQIIWEAGQVYGINPQVILVMLQKESGIITDDWPVTWQYRTAMGYACPDTAPCNEQYYGFYNQVSSAAWQLKRYYENPDSYNFKAGVSRYIGYNPNSSCGGSSVFLENSATAALYNYTPYQPNDATLSNLTDTNPGGTAPCGAYGNRNFWWFFNKWFGSSYGSLFRTADSPSLFYTNGHYKFIVPSAQLISEYGFSLADVRFVSTDELNAIPLAPLPLSQSLGQVVKSESDSDADGGAVYLVSGGYKIPIGTISQLSDLGAVSDNIHYLPLLSIERLLTAPSLSNYIKGSDNSIYKLESGKYRAIFELSKLNQLNPSGKLTSLSDYTLSGLPFGTPIVDGVYVIIGPDSGVRAYEGSSYYVVPSMSTHQCLGLKNIKTFRIKSYSLTNGSRSNDLGCAMKDTADNQYIANGDRKFRFTSNLAAKKAPEEVIQKLPESSLTRVVKAATGTELSEVVDETLRPIPNMDIFGKLGLTKEDITTLPNDAYHSLQRGAKIIPPGTLVLESNGAVSITTSPSTRHRIISIGQFVDYGFMGKSLIKIDNTDAEAYPISGNLGRYSKAGGSLYFVDRQVRYLVPSDLDFALNIDRATLPELDQAVVTASTLPWKMTEYIKSVDSPAIYKIVDGKKRPLASWDVFLRESDSRPDKLIIISPEATSYFPTGQAIY